MMIALALSLALALPTPTGWQATGELEVHDTAPKIFAAINGAADLYFSYGLEQILVREYRRADLEVEVEVYELGEPLDAFGTFQRERPRSGATAVDIGAEAVVTDNQCLARQGRFYLKAKAFSGALSAPLCRDLLLPLLASLKTADEPPELSLLPSAGRVPGSLGYARERYLGLSALVRCVHAEYKSGEDAFRVFVMVRGNWDSLTKGWQPVAGQPRPVVQREIPYTGWVAVGKTERGMIGVVTANEKSTVARLRSLLATD